MLWVQRAYAAAARENDSALDRRKACEFVLFCTGKGFEV